MTISTYILVVEGMKDSLGDTLRYLRKQHPEHANAKLLLITKDRSMSALRNDSTDVIYTDYTEENLSMVLAPYGKSIVGVLCRGDKYVQYLRKIIPYLPENVLVSSTRSLEIATNKRMMRQAFTAKYPEITPKFEKVIDASDDTVQKILRNLELPVIVKPASLASSILIQKCNDSNEIVSALGKIFASLRAIYQKEGRHEPPEIIVEEFLVGRFFSIDVYVLEKGNVFYTPIVEYTPAESLGIDDFFLYKRWLPTDLSPQDEEGAQIAAKKSIDAAGLSYTSAHVELVKTTRGWKIIEIGPRIGRFRNTMYSAGYDFDHGYNDLLIHLGYEPTVAQKKPVAFVAAYSIYPESEGVLEKLEGIDEFVERNEGKIRYCSIDHEAIGRVVAYAKNGGHALAEIVFVCQSKQDYDATCTWLEKNVKAVISEGK